jgi:ATP-dependent helicase HrpB
VPDPLPIDVVLPPLVEALRAHSSAVLVAPTGAGKTTRVPPALLDAGLAGTGQVVMLEPRRLAARAAARRIAYERGVELGGEVGFQVRFERRASSATRILVVTEGLLVRMLQDDPFLERAGAVVFDEVHERSLDTDLALALVRKVQREARPELRIVAMSATLAPQPLAEFLGGAPVVTSEGRLFPVEVRWLEREEDLPLQTHVVRGVADALEHGDGDVLAFLPGGGEIRRASEALADLARRRSVDLVELYGDLPPEKQDRALLRGPRRRVVLATNVAQSSVTVEGVTAVVDSGLARFLRFDPSVGLDRLELDWISRASADQRAGRAGRTAPGACFRLWTEARQRSLAAEDEPEIRRVDLGGALLELALWGERDPAAFAWYEAPPGAAVERALALLADLGALEGGAVTATGRAMARLPTAPRLARLLLEGARLGQGERVALAAALLAERDPFRRERKRAPSSSESDVLDRTLALEAFEQRGHAHSEVGELLQGPARQILRARDQLARLASGAPRAESRDLPEALERALLAAFPDRLARRRAPGDRRGVLTSGRGVRLAEESAVLEPEWFVCVETDAGRRGERAEALVRVASGVRAEWIPRERFRRSVELAFDEERERVVALRRTLLDALVVEEVQVALPDGPEVAQVLCEAASRHLDRALALDAPAVAALLARVRSLAGWRPELELPSFGVDDLRAALPDLCAGKSSFEELRRAALDAVLRNRLTHTQLQALEREAPERIEVPTGSRIALAYEPGRPPVLAVRIQELFGWTQTPRVAAGRVPVLLHLLGPNYRPQQVTDDLASFWKNTYPEVRKELKRRYPRHSWPEDPLSAPPVRGAPRRK